MNRAPITTALAQRGQWLTEAQLLRATDADYPEEHYFYGALQAHLRAGDVLPRLTEADATEYGLAEWAAAPPPDDEPMLQRIQRITRAQWGEAHVHREPVVA